MAGRHGEKGDVRGWEAWWEVMSGGVDIRDIYVDMGSDVREVAGVVCGIGNVSSQKVWWEVMWLWL